MSPLDYETQGTYTAVPNTFKTIHLFFLWYQVADRTQVLWPATNTPYLGHLADMEIVSMTSNIIQLRMLHCEVW
jgi:hypothetical protein